MESWPKDAMGRTPLELSVLHDHLPCAVRLLEADFDGFKMLVVVNKKLASLIGALQEMIQFRWALKLKLCVLFLKIFCFCIC